MGLSVSVEGLDEDIAVLISQELSPQAQARILAEAAQDALAEGEAIDTAVLGHKPTHRTFVDGSEVSSLDGVKPNSTVVFEFNVWDDLIPFALQALIDRSPERSGRYKQSWFAMVDGARVARVEDIPPTANVILVNDQPYSRKIDVGHMKMSVPPGIVEAARHDILDRFGNSVGVEHITMPLPGGYILKGRFRKGVGRNARRGLRKDTQAGAEMTYPALSIAARG